MHRQHSTNSQDTNDFSGVFAKQEKKIIRFAYYQGYEFFNYNVFSLMFAVSVDDQR
jgi:hypothetical protein